MSTFFFSSVQIYMKDPDCTEKNEKSNFRLYFSSSNHFCIQYMGKFQLIFTITQGKKPEIFFYFCFSRFLNYLGCFSTTDMQNPPQKWPSQHKVCAMC